MTEYNLFEHKGYVSVLELLLEASCGSHIYPYVAFLFIIPKQAKENQKGGQGGTLLSLISDEAKYKKHIDTKTVLSEKANVSRDTVFKVKKIKEVVKDEKILNNLRDGTTSINKVIKDLRKKEIEKERSKIALVYVDDGRTW